ncbi:hypothetical protein BH09BAC2_BH09BAC2_16010 [soil metagenome]
MHNCNVLFLTLKIFSSTGGIEKVCRIVGKALTAMTIETGKKVCINSMHDEQKDINSKYFSQDIFRGFGGNKIKFVLKSISSGRKNDVVILSHINLLIIGYAIKVVSPKTKLILFAHGIEVWNNLPGWKLKMLKKCDLILPVSEFTKNKMISLYGIEEKKLTVLNNCLDPFLPKADTAKRGELLNRYGLNESDKIILTVSRLTAKEKYKGYDQVIYAVKELSNQMPDLKYLLIGKYDEDCKQRLDALVKENGIEDKVIFTGFIDDAEIADHFKLADLYVMPSLKEGFGIVFIEAMYYGLPVIAGNKDGSVDALANGELGTLVDPDDQEQLINSIENVLKNKEQYIPNNLLLMNKFSYKVYKEKLLAVLGG